MGTLTKAWSLISLSFPFMVATCRCRLENVLKRCGNRAFERALVDLEDFVCERGFCPIAAAAFVCEHSYSTADTPIAAGRPDEADLQAAEDVGRRVREKLLAGSLSPIHAADLQDEPSPEASVKKFVAFVQSFRARHSLLGQRLVFRMRYLRQCLSCRSHSGGPFGRCSALYQLLRLREGLSRRCP